MFTSVLRGFCMGEQCQTIDNYVVDSCERACVCVKVV